MSLTQPVLIPGAVAGLEPIDTIDANRLVTEWDHNLGPCRRPFGMEGWALCVHGRPVAVAISASIVSAHVTDPRGRQWQRGEVVELARQAASEPWANRVMLRLWREVAAPQWSYWPVLALVSYSQSRRHSGDMYRFDGWECWSERSGSMGGGTWSRPRYATDAVAGPKRLWGWIR